MGFREDHPELQQLVREHGLLRGHNLSFREGDPQDTLLLFAEAALVCVMLERFVRAVLGAAANDNDTLPNLLEMATSRKRRLLRLPGANRRKSIDDIVAVRNTLLHGNYEQAAKQAGCVSVGAYFKGPFAAETNDLYKVFVFLCEQIDVSTGRPISPSDDGATKPARRRARGPLRG